MNILVVAAHPDDEVLGCGGTVARLTGEGHVIYCVILGEGITSRYNQPEQASKSELKQLKTQAKDAAKILGIKETIFGEFPDNRFDTVPLLEIVKAIEKVKNSVKPDVVYTHHQGDLNIDHQITFKAVLTACRPVKGETVKDIYSFEIPSSTEWSSPDKQNYFMPNVFVDISKTLVKKLEALKAYKGEAREYPHPRSLEALRAIAMRWGSTVGLEAVEAFQLIRSIR
jgi:LmbE family N-acetylglucosaminyl deacetylase